MSEEFSHSNMSLLSEPELADGTTTADLNDDDDNDDDNDESLSLTAGSNIPNHTTNHSESDQQQPQQQQRPSLHQLQTEQDLLRQYFDSNESDSNSVQRTTSRERFPSFDSQASSGSVVRYVSATAASTATIATTTATTATTTVSAQVTTDTTTTSSSSSNTPRVDNLASSTALLPYHERLKRKQQQQQQQQNQPPSVERNVLTPQMPSLPVFPPMPLPPHPPLPPHNFFAAAAAQSSGSLAPRSRDSTPPRPDRPPSAPPYPPPYVMPPFPPPHNYFPFPPHPFPPPPPPPPPFHGAAGPFFARHARGDSSGSVSSIERRYHQRLPSIDNDDWSEPDENTRLLPTGISTNEHDESARLTTRTDNTTTARAVLDYERDRRNARRSRRRNNNSGDDSVDTDYHNWMEERAQVLEREKLKWMTQWKEEMRREAEERRLDRVLARQCETCWRAVMTPLGGTLAYWESFFANLPITIGAIALSVANLGVDWFKFTEENLDSCQPVHFHSAQCTFPEFPGCFYCDKTSRMYQIAEYFHFVCSSIAGLLALCFIAKLVVARRVVWDELSSPTTASPAGLLCMTLDVVFAGRGIVGMIFVSVASCVHLCLAIWFMYMALAYHIMPEPSWFPNTTGIGISAVKTWLYHPMAGHFLMAISLSLNFFFFPMSLVRVFLNKKISATVGWMQMAAPNVSLYALTIMAQPSFEEEHPDINSFQRVHRMVYLPCMHFLFVLCLLGIAASIYSLVVRWDDFRKLQFSPAHAAFCAPCLSHANAIQAYRAAVNSFSDLPAGSPFLVGLYVYWLGVLVGGTCVTLYVAGRYIASLPSWTHFDLADEIEPPAPYATTMNRANIVSTGDTVIQPFVSPAILQANETGTLVLTRDAQGRQKYVRTRKVTALGFEPIMNILEMERERELLLDWVGKNEPRRRNRTLSVPGIDFRHGQGFGTGNSGVYDMDTGRSRSWRGSRTRRPRASTSSPHVPRNLHGSLQGP